MNGVCIMNDYTSEHEQSLLGIFHQTGWWEKGTTVVGVSFPCTVVATVVAARSTRKCVQDLAGRD